MPIYLAAVICLSFALNGALGILVAPLSAICIAPVLIIRRADVRLSLISALVLVLACVDIAASVYNGFSAEGLCNACLPLAVFALSLALSALDRVERRSLMTSICGFTAVIAVIAFVLYVFFSDSGAVSGKHLTYGYDSLNVAALWFAVTTLMCFALIGHNRFLCLALGINTAGLLLTCSVLVVGLWLIALLVVFIARRDDEVQMGLFCYVFAGIVFAVAYYFCQDIQALEVVLIVVFAAVLWFMDMPTEKLVGHKMHYILAAVTVAAVIVGCVFSLRFQREFPTMLSAVVLTMADGMRAIAANPLCGIGAGMWQYLGLWYQNTAYGSVYVHNSFMQYGVDSGILAMLLVCAIYIAGIVCGRRAGFVYMSAYVIIGIVAFLTSALMQFAGCALAASVCCLAMAERKAPNLVSADDAEGEDLEACAGAHMPAALSVIASVLVIVVMVFAGRTYSQVISYVALAESSSDDYTTLTTTFANSPAWVINSPAARVYYDNAVLYEAIARETESEVVAEEAENLWEQVNAPLVYDTIAQAYIYGTRYEFDEGLTLLLDAAEQAPQSAYLYSVIQSYLSGSNCSDDLIDEALSLAEANGYEIEYTELTEEDKELYEEAKEEYLSGQDDSESL